MVTRILYLLLFPAMLIVFVCFELGFTEYGIVVPVLTIAGVVILVLGAVSYFVYDPYRLDRKNHKKADRYIRDIEKAAVKEVELEEKALAKQARKQEKLELKEEARQERAAKRRERKNRRDEKLTGWKESIREKLPAKKKATEESRTETGIPKEPEAVTEEKPQAGAEESGTTETTGPVENTEPVETVEQKDAPAEPEQGTPEETGKAEEIDTTNGGEIMAYYLIDFENVKSRGMEGVELLAEEDTVCIFYSDNADSMTFDLHRKLNETKAQIIYHKVAVGTKNALDFQLATYLGYLIVSSRGKGYTRITLS